MEHNRSCLGRGPGGDEDVLMSEATWEAMHAEPTVAKIIFEHECGFTQVQKLSFGIQFPFLEAKQASL